MDSKRDSARQRVGLCARLGARPKTFARRAGWSEVRRVSRRLGFARRGCCVAARSAGRSISVRAHDADFFADDGRASLAAGWASVRAFVARIAEMVREARAEAATFGAGTAAYVEPARRAAGGGCPVCLQHDFLAHADVL